MRERCNTPTIFTPKGIAALASGAVHSGMT